MGHVPNDKMTLREVSEYLQSLPESLMDMPGTLVVHCDDGDISPKKADSLNEVDGAETDTMRQVVTAEDVYWKYVDILGQKPCDRAVVAYLQTDSIVELVLENSTPELLDEYLNGILTGEEMIGWVDLESLEEELEEFKDENGEQQDRVDWLHEGL